MQKDPLVFKLHKVLKQNLKPKQHYLLAVSGGSDSMALADGCAFLHAEGYADFTVCHVEHGLRGEESLADMRVVQNFCFVKNLPCFVEHVDVPKHVVQKHLSTEEAARDLRYAALFKIKAMCNCNAVITAHNQDDQAETVLLRLLRGSGTQGLGGIRYRSKLALRPLLSFTHAQLMEYCHKCGITYCHDSTNDDLQYTRNRVRHELIPYLESNFNVDIKSALVRLALLQQEDADYLDKQAELLLNDLLLDKVQNDTGGMILQLDAIKLRQQDAALRKRVLRTAYFSLENHPLDYERTLALDRLCLAGVGGKVVQLPGFVTAAYKKNRIIFIKY